MQWLLTFLIGGFYVFWLGVVVTIVFILPVIGGPILLRRALRQPLRPVLHPLDPDAGEVTLPVRRHFRKIVEKLAPEGFRPLGYFLLGDQLPGVKAVVLLLEDPAAHQSALMAALYRQVQPDLWRLQMAYLTFFADFMDGLNVSTHNSTTLGAFARAPGRVVAQFPQERDPRRLYQLHLAMVRRLQNAAARRPRDGQTTSERLQDLIVREVEAQIATGYYFRDEAGGVYRPTWKGAVLMAWKMLPPARLVRWALLLARSSRLRRRISADAHGVTI